MFRAGGVTGKVGRRPVQAFLLLQFGALFRQRVQYRFQAADMLFAQAEQRPQALATQQARLSKQGFQQMYAADIFIVVLQGCGQPSRFYQRL